jgi:hypothetical protein
MPPFSVPLPASAGGIFHPSAPNFRFKQNYTKQTPMASRLSGALPWHVSVQLSAISRQLSAFIWVKIREEERNLWRVAYVNPGCICKFKLRSACRF